jgi:sugar phosphate isomerase/epimerase
MIRLAAFADEISPDLEEQIRVCRDNGVTHVELRGVDHKNVLDFDNTLRAHIRQRLAASGLAVVSIASPIGKVRIDEPWPQHFDRFKIAVELAGYFSAPLIRIFSYYPPAEGRGAAGYREQVIERMHAKVRQVQNLPVTLVHENEKDIFGEKGPQCVDLMQSVDSPKLRSAFDFANFVQVGDRALENWPALKPFTAHIHIKDAIRGTGKVVAAGEGDGDIPTILADAYRSGYRGFVSLEPHLKVAGHSHGETGPELFKTAADALKRICADAGNPIAKS